MLSATKKHLFADTLLPCWVKLWLLISGIICTIDIAYNLLKPMTLRGHELGIFYYLWNIYGDVDLRYSSANDIVTCTLARLMILEVVLDFAALIMDSRRSKHTIVTTFFTTVLVFWKTCVYMTLYAFPPPGNPSYFAADASTWKIFWIFWVANGFWIVIPLIIIICLWPNLTINNEILLSS